MDPGGIGDRIEQDFGGQSMDGVGREIDRWVERRHLIAVPIGTLGKSFTGQDPAGKRFQRVVRLLELFGEEVEQFRIARRVGIAKIVGGVNDAAAKILRPNSIRDVFIELMVLVRHPLREVVQDGRRVGWLREGWLRVGWLRVGWLS